MTLAKSISGYDKANGYLYLRQLSPLHQSQSKYSVFHNPTILQVETLGYRTFAASFVRINQAFVNYLFLFLSKNESILEFFGCKNSVDVYNDALIFH